MARTPEQQAARTAKKPNMRAPGAQAFGMMADAVTPPDVPAGVRAFDSMAGTVAPPSAPPLPGNAVAVSDRPNFTMPPQGPTTAVTPSTRPNWTTPPPGTSAPPGTAVAVSNRPNFTMPGAEVLGNGPAATRNNVGAVDAAIKAPTAPKPTLGARAEPFLHGLVPGVAGFLTAGAVNDGRQKEAEAEAASLGARSSAQPYFAKPGEIPKAVDGTVPQAGPAPVAGSFLNQSELGRNFGNAVMALPGGGAGLKATQTALAALPIAARGVRAAQAAVPATIAAAQGFVGGDANFPGKPSTPAADAPMPQAEYGNEHLRGAKPEFDSTGKMIKTVGKDGRVTYSGGNITGEDMNIYSPDGTLVNGGDPRNPKGMGVSVVGSEGHRQNLLELQRNAAERAAAPAPAGAAGIGGAGSTTFSQDLRAKTDAGRMPAGLSARQTANFQQQQAQTQQQGEIAQMQNATAQAGQAQGMRVAEMNNATHREGLNVQREGHALTHETNMLQRKIAMGQQQYQRQKDAVELGMKEREFQTGRSDKDFEQKGTREKALQTKIEQRFTSNHPLTGNPQVDANQVRVFRENMDRAVARLGADGVHKLSPKDEEKLFAATDLLQKVQANASNINPLKPDLLKTIDAVDLTNLQQDPKTGDFVINSDNPKVHGQVIPKRFLQTEEAHSFTFGGMRGTPTNRFDMLTNGARQ